MELQAALGRVGAKIVKTTMRDASPQAPQAANTMYLRVDEKEGHKWVDAITSLLIASADKSRKFSADVSKYFYADNGEIRYLWRVVISGDVERGHTVFASAAMEASMAHVKEVTSIPLVGRRQYEFNPLKGKFMGGYDYDTGQAVVAAALSGAVQ